MRLGIIALAAQYAILLQACQDNQNGKLTKKRMDDITMEQNSEDAKCYGKKGLYVIKGTKISASAHPYSSQLNIGQNGLCSGTFVSPEVFITAAHCVTDDGRDKNVSVDEFEVNGKNPLKSIYNPENPLTFKRALENWDFAVLIFAKGTSSKYVPVLDRAPAIGEEVTLVGFGPSSWNGHDTAKREGKNTLTGFESDDAFLTGENRQGTGVATAPGDSGGTALIDGKLAGSMVGGDGHETFFANVFSKSNRDFLRSIVEKENVEICGLDGYDCEKPPTQDTPDSSMPSEQTPTDSDVSSDGEASDNRDGC